MDLACVLKNNHDKPIPRKAGNMPGNITSLAVHHEQYMRRCIELARIARDHHNTPVGSLIVLDGAIVGEGIETLPVGNDLTGHAEILACQAAVDHTGSKLLVGATLYSTAEPCFMCSYAIRSASLALVVYGVDTPEIGGVSSTHPILTDTRLSTWGPPPSVLTGILEDECRALRLEMKNE